MDFHSRKDVVITLDKNLLATLSKLGQLFQNMERLYCDCCSSLGISKNSLELVSLNTKTNKITIRGLELPSNIIKYFSESPTEISKVLLTDTESEETSKIDFFEQIAKGIDKVDPKDLQTHIMQAVKYHIDQ